MKLGLLKVAVSRRAYLIKEIGINCVMDRGSLQISLFYERNIREGRQNSDTFTHKYIKILEFNIWTLKSFILS